MATIYYLPDEQEVVINNGDNILATSNCVGILHTHVCGGNARCSTCRVVITEGLEYCSPRNDKEQLLADKMGFTDDIRLACQTTVNGNVKLRRLVLDNEDIEYVCYVAGDNVCSVGQEKLLAILFSDIRGFTTFSEKMLPYDVIHILNRYFNKMGTIINDNGGYIDNYMGDGLLALFEAPDAITMAQRSIKTATEMLIAVDELNQYIEPLYQWKMEIGIGIHIGNVVVGTIGAISNRRNTVIGDAVNLASRIESANKEVATHILISEDLYKQVTDQVQIGKRVSLHLKGKSGEFMLYEVTGLL